MPEGTAIVRRHVLKRGEVERACRGEALLLAESNMDLLQMMLLWSRAGLQRRSAFIGEVERACRGEALLLAESNMDLLQMMLLWSRAGLQRRSAFLSRVEHGSFEDDAVMEKIIPAAEEERLY